jgi:hypothetical protein
VARNYNLSSTTESSLCCVGQLTALTSVPRVPRTMDATHAREATTDHDHKRPTQSAAGKQTNQPANHEHHSTTSKEHDCAGVPGMAAGITEFGARAGGPSGDATVAIPSPAAGRLRLPHPATARNLPSAADHRLAELCLQLRRGLSSIQTRGDAACRKCSRRRRREGTRWTEWLRGHERVRRAIAALTARGGR